MIPKHFLEKKPISFLTLAYVVALSLIAGMSGGAHLVVKYVIAEQEESARTINIAGRQRMLSQRIALYMMQGIDGNNANAQNKLLESVNLFEKAHVALTQGDTDMQLKGEMPDVLRDIYYREPYNLDQSVQQYIKYTRIILADTEGELTKESQVFKKALTMAQGDLLKNLDIAVKAYEKTADQKIQRLVRIQEFSILAILIVIILEAFIIFRPLIFRIKRYAEKIEEIAAIDFLTGTLNRRSIFEVIDKEMSRSTRYEHDFSLLICDIDHFKKVNDTYGHQVGDDALKHFSNLIEKALRKEDVLGRIGGEEFIVLLPQTSKEEASKVAEKLRSTVESYPMNFEHEGEQKELFMKASFGLTTFDKFKDSTSDDLYLRADQALYEAKETGRNRVVEK